jgi:formylglycine-generating enzyme required for sulfatase activity
MQRWFLSYHSPDHALAERLKAAIERRDSSTRVFFAPSHLRAGSSWSAQLAQEIAEANAFILLVGESGVGNWQVPEYDEALDRWVKSPSEFALIVVLLEGQSVPGLPFVRRLHFVVSPDPASEKDIGRICEAASGRGSQPGALWRYTAPYRGLDAMQERDSDYFFGRTDETVNVLSSLASASDRLPVLIGNSGVGKSSLAQAGVLAALKRQAWPEGARAPNAWPSAFQDSRQWSFLTLRPGADPLKAIVDSFLDTWGYTATDFERARQLNGWVELLRDGKATLTDMIDATARRCAELKQPAAPGYFLYVDQGEELYVRAEEAQRRRFSDLVARALADPRLHIMMSLRSDFLGHLQGDEPLFRAREQIDVPPLREAELREVISRPAQLLAARFESESLIDIITQRTAEDSIRDVGALPLLSYTLDDMWTQMVRSDDGILRLPAQSFELGGVLVSRADNFLASRPDAEPILRRVLTLRLATVRDDGEPTRRRATRGEFSPEEWRLVSDLADYPNRLLVTAVTGSGESYAEVAHEAIFRRWGRLREWIAAEREFLVWRSGLDAARRAWEAAPPKSRKDALLMGFALAQARNWLSRRGADLSDEDRRFVEQSRKTARGRSLRTRILIGALALPIAAILVLFAVVIGREQLKQLTVVRPFMNDAVRPYVLSASAESVLKPGDVFHECASPPGKDYCPQMVVVPAGQFTMGSPEIPMSALPNITVQQIAASLEPQHQVTIPAAFAVSKNEITFDEWDTSVADGDCGAVEDYGLGRGQQPAVGVGFAGVECYVAWLSKVTGKAYRLLSEAEYEYAARAGTQTVFPWGDQAGTNNANCKDCGSEWDGVKPAPVGSFPPNAFGLNDMVGNIFEWVADCWHDNYQGAPADGSPWLTGGDCTRRPIRGGSFYYPSTTVASAFRYWAKGNTWGATLGFRVARTLVPPGKAAK